MGVEQTRSSGNAAFFVVGPALLVAAVAAFAPGLLADGDTYWHVATGEWILRHGAVPHTDPFSYTMPGAPWRTHEWLSEVLIAWAFRAGGWPGVRLLFALAMGAMTAVMAQELGRWLRPVGQVTALLLALSIMAFGMLARPHLLALPVLALWTVQLMRARERRSRPPLWLLPVMTLWANLHGSFVMGLGLIAPFALEAVMDPSADRAVQARAWALFAFGAVIAALVTPHGAAAFVYPLEVSGMKVLPHIREWGSARFEGLYPLELGLLGLLYLMATRQVRVPPFRLLLLLGLLHMGLHHERHQLVLACVGPLLLAEPLARAFAAEARTAPAARGGATTDGLRWRTLAPAAVAAVAAGLILALRLMIPAPLRDAPTTPLTALAHVPPEVAARPVFNEYGMGGYLILSGVKPYIDGRSDMYGDRFSVDYFETLRADRARLEQTLDRHHVGWTLLDPKEPAVQVLDASPRWRRLYADRYAVVHVPVGRTAS